jgi:hypothetical protein
MAPRAKKVQTSASADQAGSAGKPVEKRKVGYLHEPDDTYAPALEKIQSERMFVMKVTDKGEYGDVAMGFHIKSGTHGTIRDVTIGGVNKCDCPSAVSLCCRRGKMFRSANRS